MVSSLPSFGQTVAEDQAIVTYNKDYFTRYEPVTLLDMLQRVPGVQAIIDKNKGQQNNSGTSSGGKAERGFGSGGDQILINSKRLSGKANKISDTLARISAASVQRVDIIRGASGDIDVQSQGLVVNVIMAEGADTSSTFWKIGGRYSETYVFSPDFLISHNGSKGNIDYILGASVKQNQHIDHRFDQTYTPGRVFSADAERRSDNLFKTLKFNGNLTYNGENGDEFRLNGQFEPGTYRKREPRFTRDLNQPKVLQNWSEDQKKSEVGTRRRLYQRY
ncbi:MAG: TonB-dependent receptor plug domain-containing protein [Kordiimonadaceae bacterium]|nr:TonB-dependent receptor plug domain-containing protein [Kordiimonadaceae bacterium]MBT6033959.1 TonB-dependent receptor plug domain-containing protein [Kordiimonadaceae bacterium]